MTSRALHTRRSGPADLARWPIRAGIESLAGNDPLKPCHIRQPKPVPLGAQLARVEVEKMSLVDFRRQEL